MRPLPLAAGGAPRAVDPVCGMTVDPARAAAREEHGGRAFHFCHPRCAERFRADPEGWASGRNRILAMEEIARGRNAEARGAATPTGAEAVAWVCPMCPEVRESSPGPCPVCGMALEREIPVATGDAEPSPEERDFARRFAVAAALTVPLLIIAMGDHVIPGHPFARLLPGRGLAWTQAALATPVVAWCGLPLLRRAVDSVRRRSPNMFTLVALGVVAAWGQGLAAAVAPDAFPAAFRIHGEVPLYFESAAVIVALVLAGQRLEHRARARTGAALRSLLRLAPETAHRVAPDGSEVDVPAASVRPGDRLRVRPGEAFPVDAVIVEGTGAVDESMLTGESLPVERGPGDEVLAGTANGHGGLLVEARRTGADSAVARVVQRVAEAQRSRPRVQALADAVSARFVPAVVVIAMATFAAWSVLGGAEGPGHGLVAAVSVLVIACPCALGLAVPMSVTVGMGRGAALGVLFRDAEALERLERVDLVAVDKTGTLTEGRPRVVDVVPAPGVAAEEVLAVAAAVDRWSEHPLARAVAAAAAARGVGAPPSEGFVATPGRGAEARVRGARAVVGHALHLRALDLDTGPVEAAADAAAAEGRTPVFVAHDGRVLGVILLADRVRPGAADAVAHLRAEGVEVVMLTGDRRGTAERVGAEVGITRIHPGLTPSGKEEAIASLQAKGRVVAMAGDGVNDAPALARADVGVAMGGGSDAALRTAGVALLRGDLGALLRARALSRTVMRNVRGNLLLAFAYNVVCIPVAAGALHPAFGILPSPALAGLAMTLSSLSVIANALRLRHAN